MQIIRIAGDIADEINAGNTAPLIYVGWEIHWSIQDTAGVRIHSG